MKHLQGGLWRRVSRLPSASRHGKNLSDRACRVLALLITCFAVGELHAQDGVRRIDVVSGGSTGGSVSTDDRNDWYLFTLSGSGTVTLTISELAADADLCLYDSSVDRESAETRKCHHTDRGQDGRLGKSSDGSTTIDTVRWPLGPGTYYIRVDLYAGNFTDYRLAYGLEAPPELRLSTSDLRLDENSTGSYTVVLTSRPSDNVPVDVTSGDPAVTVSRGASTARRDSVRLTFTPTNWDFRQTVTVYAEDDDDADDETVRIANRTTALLLDGGETVSHVTVHVEDDDKFGVAVTSLSPLVVAEGSSESYTVSLTTEPAGTVTITPQPDPDNAELTITPSSGELTAQNWRNGVQFTVSAAQDANAVDERATIAHVVSGSEGSGYEDLTSAGAVTVRVDDDDTVGVAVTSLSPLVVAEGSSESYTVSLTTEPAGTVTITPSSDNPDLTVSPARLMFTPNDWNSPQEVTVSAAEDDDALDESATISHAVSGYGSVTTADDVTVSITDPATVPGPPRNLTATPGDGQVSLNWTEPASDGGSPIIRYDYQVDDEQWVPTGGTATSHVVRNLVNGTSYTFRVRAVNSVSEDSPSSESVSASDSATPTAGEEVKEAVTETVEAVTAATAANITANIGTRFSATPSSGSVVVVGGRTLNLGSGSTSSELPVATGRDRDSPAKPGRIDETWSPGIDDLLQSSAFEISLNAAEDGDEMSVGSAQWTVWGRGDLQFFESRPDRGATYDGDLRAGYLGIDARFGDRWLAGVAVSRTNAEADYDTGGDGAAESGSLEVKLTGVHPYLRYVADARSELWTILGAGQGEIENSSADDMTRETSDMRMLMGAAGIRHSLDPVESLNFAYLSDVGFARVETDDGLEAIDGLTVDTWRLRMGVEASHNAELESGAALTSFMEVAGRFDGGGDEEEVGLEISPGFYLSDPSTGFGVEVRGRLLALHSAENYKERGVSVTASVSPGPGDLGLSLSLSPRWGAPTGDAETLWRDHALERLDSSDERRDALSFDARLGYGLRSMDGLLTPFGEFGVRNEDSRRVRVGAQFARQSRSLGILSVELSGERRDDAWDDSEHRVGLVGRLRF